MTSTPPSTCKNESLSPRTTTARKTVTTGSHVLRSASLAAPMQGNPARDDNKARIDVRDEDHKRRLQRSERDEVRQRLTRVNDRTQAKQGEELFAAQPQGVLAERKGEGHHADRRE